MRGHKKADQIDWLKCLILLRKTYRQFLRMYENEVQELNLQLQLQLRKAREDIFGLVQMHAEVSKERDQLRVELAKAKAEVLRLQGQTTEMSGKLRGLANVTAQNQHLFNENQRLLSELRDRETL